MKKLFLLIAVFAVLIKSPLYVFSGGNPDDNNAEGKKYALVIGNDDYSRFGKLSGAGKDAAAVAQGLAKIDFEVTLLTDATAAQMNNAIDAFAVKLRESPDNQGFFWFSGHGVQLGYIGHIIGTDADTSLEQVKAGSVSLGKIFEIIGAAKNEMNVVIVDADLNPINNSETAVSLESALLAKLPDNICYIRSTSPGEYSADASPFIDPVLKYLNTPADMAFTFPAIARETVTASRNTQSPLFYTSGKQSTR